LVFTYETKHYSHYIQLCICKKELFDILAQLIINHLSTLLQNNILQGIISGIIASSIFLLVLFMLKPRLVIGDKIACQYINFHGRDLRIYTFKVINKSLLFKLYDVKVMAYICEVLPNTNGDDIHATNIKLLGTETRTLATFNRRHFFQNILLGDSLLKSRTDYAAQFSTEANLKTVLKNNTYIKCEVLAKHALTGFSKVFTREFKHESKIIDGTFLSGNSCEIIKKSFDNKTIIS
jgi:hypothetical protein